MGYRRWYDTDSRLGEVVHTMEKLNPDTQLYFAQKLLEISEEMMAQNGGEEYLAELDERKKKGLDKSGGKKRWYDQNETLHQAFNNLYALPGIDRRMIANKLGVPIRIVAGYERHCAQRGKHPESSVIQEILRSSFFQGRERTQKLYSIYMMDISELDANKPGSIQATGSGDSGLWTQLLTSLQKALA